MEGSPQERASVVSFSSMRSVSSWLFGRQAGGQQGEAAGSRPEVLRRRTIAANARIVLFLAVIFSPLAIHALLRGTALPFVLDIIGLTIGVLSVALLERGHYERAAATQVYGTL